MNQDTQTVKPAASRLAPILWIAGILLLVVSLWSLLAPGVITPVEISRMHSSKHNLKQLGYALHDYHDHYGSLPPGLLVPADGGPAYGWPVLLLPEIEERTRFEKIDFQKPYWDADNQKLMNVDIEMYRNPMFGYEEIPTASLQYALNSRVFQPNRYTKISEITDGFSNTFMGGEIAEGIRLWYQPDHTRDPALGLNKGPQTFGTPYYGTRYGENVQMLMMDGSVRAIPNDTDLEVLKALATPADDDDPGDF